MRALFRLGLEAAMMIWFVFFILALRSALRSLQTRQAAAELNALPDPSGTVGLARDRGPAFLRRDNFNSF
jgi:hypothetical protein